jgi:hypothetical protein
MAATCCWRRSRVSTRRRFAEDGTNCRRNWRAVRPSGYGGRERASRCWKKDLTLVPDLQEVVAPETAGDPMSRQTWIRSSLRTLSERLQERGHAVSPPTVGRVLKNLK